MNETIGGLIFGGAIALVGVVGLLFLNPLVAFFKRSQRKMSGDGDFGDKQVGAITKRNQGIVFSLFIVGGLAICIFALTR